MTFYHHGHGAFLCSVGYGHVCGEDEDYEDRVPGGPGGEGGATSTGVSVPVAPPTRPGGVPVFSPSVPTSRGTAGRVTPVARLAGVVARLRWRLWEWRHRGVLRRRFDYVKRGTRE